MDFKGILNVCWGGGGRNVKSRAKQAISLTYEEEKNVRQEDEGLILGTFALMLSNRKPIP